MLVASKAAFLKNYLAVSTWIFNGSLSTRTISKGFQKCFHILKCFKVPGITSNIPRNKSALVMGICATFTCFQTFLPQKHSTIKTSLKTILKQHSRNIYVQNLHVFSCFDFLVKINVHVNIQDCSPETAFYAFYCWSETQNLPSFS